MKVHTPFGPTVPHTLEKNLYMLKEACIRLLFAAWFYINKQKERKAHQQKNGQM